VKDRVAVALCLTGRRAVIWTVAAAALAMSVGGGAVVASAPASATGPIVFDGSPGSGPPPATLGPYSMTPFPADPQANLALVTAVAAPGGGSVTFDATVQHRIVGTSWGGWSHGYTGDVYCTTTSACASAVADQNNRVLTLPPNTVAFYFYAAPDHGVTANITATAQDGTTSGPISVSIPTAQYFGFYGTPNDPITTISISMAAPGTGMGIGEFGIATQAPTPPTTTSTPSSIVVAPKFTG